MGQVLCQGMLANDHEAPTAFLRETDEPAHGAIEASMNWYHYDRRRDRVLGGDPWEEVWPVVEPRKVIVIGLGEVGRPMLEIVSKHHQGLGVDVLPVAEKIPGVDVMHICYPFEIGDFVGETARYIELFQPKLTIINSTVAIGTTRAVTRRTGAAVVSSPVRGKHTRMAEDLLSYTKFVGAIDPPQATRAAEHFQSLGMKTKILSSPEATELAKLSETTYFGLMIAWAQEVERYCDQLGQDYNEVVSFYEEIKFFPPVKYIPGVIGGHCVMANIEILNRLGLSEILQAIQSSNRKKMEQEARRAKTEAANGEAILPGSRRTFEKQGPVQPARS